MGDLNINQLKHNTADYSNFYKAFMNPFQLTQFVTNSNQWKIRDFYRSDSGNAPHNVKVTEIVDIQSIIAILLFIYVAYAISRN